MSLIGIANLAQQALDEHGLDDWSFKWDRARTRAGQCRYIKHEIGLSQPVFEHPENYPLALNTILHEIAHALVGSTAAHGPVWRAKAIEIGCDPGRAVTLAAPVEAPWHGTCRCGNIHRKHRMTPGRSWTCRRCGTAVSWERTA